MKEFSDLISAVVDMEWEMLLSVNGEAGATAGEKNPETFAAMRKGQFSNWSQDAVASYRDDLLRAKRENRNLMREKYIRMMEGTAPREFVKLCGELPAVSEKKRKLADEVSEQMLRQSAEMYRKYPYVSGSSRPLYAVDNTEKITSVETYQKCELLTYSLKTLTALAEHLKNLETRGESLAENIMKDSLRYYGYSSIRSAEEKACAYWQQRSAESPISE